MTSTLQDNKASVASPAPARATVGCNPGGSISLELLNLYGQTLENWKSNPVEAFGQWARSPLANDGKGFANSSINTYLAMWGKFVKFCPQRPAFANSQVIENFLNSLSGRVRTEKAVASSQPDPAGIRRRYLALMDKLFGFLVRAGIRSGNDAAPLLFELDRGLRALPKPLPVALTGEEDEVLRTVIMTWPNARWRDCRDKALLALLIGSGVKVSEVQHLKTAHVYIDRTPPQIMVAGGKNERMVPLSDGSVQIMRDWMQLRKRRASDSEVCFPGDDFSEMSASTLYRVVAAAIKKAGLSPHHTGPSVLRHTFATRQIRAGQELAVVSAWLGQQQETSTAIYKFMVVDPGGARPV